MMNLLSGTCAPIVCPALAGLPCRSSIPLRRGYSLARNRRTGNPTFAQRSQTLHLTAPARSATVNQYAMGAPYPSGLVGILLPTGLLGYAYAHTCSLSMPTGLVGYRSFSTENNGASKRRAGPHTPSRSKTGNPHTATLHQTHI